MKRIFTLLFLSAFLFTSCSKEGPQGPRGPEGPAGPGVDGLGYTYEATVDFEYLDDSNMYSALIIIPDDVATINPAADAVLVYRLEIVEDSNGEDVDAWSLIPQNFFLEEGIIQYVYNHTVEDVEIIIDGDFDLSNLGNGFTQDQTFRIVVLPSDWIDSMNVDTSDIKNVMKAMDVQEKDVKKASF